MEDLSGTDQISLDLDGVVARYGRKLAQAELEAEVATQRAQKAEKRITDLVRHITKLEAEASDEATDD